MTICSTPVSCQFPQPLGNGQFVGTLLPLLEGDVESVMHFKQVSASPKDKFLSLSLLPGS